MNHKKQSKKENRFTKLFYRVVRAIKDKPWSRKEIQDLLQHSDGAIDPQEQDMLTGVFEVAETHVREVMVPRSQMVVVEHHQSLEEMLKVIVNSGHSRFPVVGEERDHFLGVLLAKDVLKHFIESSSEEFNLEKYIRSLSVIPESKRLNTLLKEFRDSRNHMAIVVDEYGGVSGLLTIEDVLEEIVGEIDDEHDPEELEFIRIENGKGGQPVFDVKALTKIEDFNHYFGVEIDDNIYDTVGGLVMHELGRLPLRGEKLFFKGFEFKVMQADRRRINMLRIKRAEQLNSMV